MKEKIQKLWKWDINYKIFQKNKNISICDTNIILILHWWWWSSNSWIKVGELLQSNWYIVIIPDLPWFWKTKLLEPLTLEWYAQIIEDFTKKIYKKNNWIILWWHSNGWAISIKIANREKIKINKLVLNNSAGIRNNNKRNLKRKILKYILKINKLKNFNKLKKYITQKNKVVFYENIRKVFYKIIWSRDYINAENNPNLKQTYLNMIKSDLQEEIKKIKNDTLIIWWKKDTYTPLSDWMYMKKNIKKSKMIILKNEKHWIHLHNPEKLVEVFIKNKFVGK